MSRSRYRPKHTHRRLHGPAPRDLRRIDAEPREHERCDFVPMHGRTPVLHTEWFLPRPRGIWFDGFSIVVEVNR